ncbi:ArsR family transcriptional regulator [Nocardiopsis gilva YIM 90087]|uniref:ArsR family transcriptional regulator n=1 Tax=Nocardiopsis gilva YIM 90087 TaxID=1235441 RepID=A0A223S3W9_9ACTN|nr:metalloregulator ArsR/SmtB family transcription factor [Nocardiopsis gilva]ASU82823.1 ArsR family transcriptional regulator [Nocardiopsis gilva YIM 90087]
MAEDQLSLTFAALADPTRREILAHLAEGEATVNELAEPFSVSLQAISKHLKVLERAGLISRGRNAQWRPCRLEAAPLQSASDWIESYRAGWEERFDRLDQEIENLQHRMEANRENQRQDHQGQGDENDGR